jgi:single-stranded-DNA-specific exonuclease
MLEKLKSNVEAVEKIVNAISNHSNIGVYADIDCDGVTSATEMYKYLKNFDINPKLLYHQRKDNHGVIINNVPKDLDLLIIVDSSSNNAKECSVLSKDIDIVILDHHQKERNNPYAIIVNPQYNEYPNKYLSGAGVVYQTCKAIDEEMLTDYADEYLDLCAVGLIGDVMNVTNPETRALINKGLQKIHNNCDENIKAVLKSLKKEYKPNATTIGFYLVPFINAIIRLGKIEDILEILTTDDEKRLKELIKSSGGMNDKRKTLQNDIVEEIDKIVDNNHKIIIADVTKLNSPKTMNGLIANSIAQKYQKPTIVVNLDTVTNMLNGSGRNYGNDFDFKEILENTQLFESVGGHSGAFGVEFKPENINKILEAVDFELENLKQEYSVEADMVIDVNDITWNFLYELQNLSFITGEGFKEPMFIIEGLPINEVKTMKDVHLKLTADDLECVKFNVSPEEIKQVEEALSIDVLGSLSINSWYNFGTKQTIRTKQVMIKDIDIF